MTYYDTRIIHELLGADHYSTWIIRTLTRAKIQAHIRHYSTEKTGRPKVVYIVEEGDVEKITTDAEILEKSSLKTIRQIAASIPAPEKMIDEIAHNLYPSTKTVDLYCGLQVAKITENYKARIAIGEDKGLIDAEIGYLKGDDVCKMNGITGKKTRYLERLIKRFNLVEDVDYMRIYIKYKRGRPHFEYGFSERAVLFMFGTYPKEYKSDKNTVFQHLMKLPAAVIVHRDGVKMKHIMRYLKNRNRPADEKTWISPAELDEILFHFPPKRLKKIRPEDDW